MSHPTWVRGLKQWRLPIAVDCKRSHPTWVRGLKLIFASVNNTINVAPYVGAWIETWKKSELIMIGDVAPYVGAWIETIHRHDDKTSQTVAPYVGAWIETHCESRG